MQLYAWTDQAGQALQQYQTCVQILSEEFGVSPQPETTDLYEAIKANQIPPRPASFQPDQSAVQALALPTKQRKQVTLLFANLASLTGQMAFLDLEPEDVEAIMTALWKRLEAVVINHGGVLTKPMGNDVLALFGAEQARETDPEQAIRAGLAMRSASQTFVKKQTIGRNLAGASQGLLKFGIHTGYVIAEKASTNDDYGVKGGLLHLADRLKQAAPDGALWISHETYLHARGIFDFQLIEPNALQLTGLTMPVYQVERAKPRAFRVSNRGIAGIETHLIGRETEMQQLKDHYHHVLTHQTAQVVTVIGEAGVGKSRLLDTFRDWLDLRPEEIWFFLGRAEQSLRQTPYALIRDLFMTRFQIQESDSASEAQRKFIADIVAFIGDNEDSHMQAHFIGQLIGFDFSESRYLKHILDNAQQIQSRAYHYISQFFLTVAQMDPLVIFLEDIHWADEGSLDLLEHLLQACQDSALLMVSLTRPELLEERPTWQVNDNHTLVKLEPLSDHHSQRLLQAILARLPEIPADLQTLIIDRAEGNPYFVEELIKMLMDDDVILTEVDPWAVDLARLSSDRLPTTLAGVLQARLDHLAPLPYLILQHAAVIGRRFWDQAVFQLQPDQMTIAEDQVVEALTQLQQKAMILAQPQSAFSGSREYL